MKNKHGQIKLLFNKHPEGTHYKPGRWAWVNEDEAKGYLDKGEAEVYGSKKATPKKSTKKTEKKEEEKAD